MTTTVIKGSALSPEILDAWGRLRRSNPGLASPYFASALTQIVASELEAVEVAVMRQGEEIVAILPFERLRPGFAGPVGSFFSDYHGVICAPNFKFDSRELLRACGLVAWDFYHAPTSQMSLAPFHRETHRAPIIDLSKGYESYVKERREAGTEQIKKNGNLLRRLEREVGPLRFVSHSPDHAMLEKLFAWKTEQFRRNGWGNIFQIAWVRRCMERIHAAQTPEFAGMLSLLYAGDNLVAAHFGMRSATVWHYWFPAYDPAFSKYSPGVMLLLQMAENSAAIGVNVIDLGCGEHSYKWRLMNGFVATASGSVELLCPATVARRVRNLPSTARRLIRNTPIGALARRIRDGKQPAH